MENKLRELMEEAARLHEATTGTESTYYSGVYDGLWAAARLLYIGQNVTTIKAEGIIL